MNNTYTDTMRDNNRLSIVIQRWYLSLFYTLKKKKKRNFSTFKFIRSLLPGDYVYVLLLITINSLNSFFIISPAKSV